MKMAKYDMNTMHINMTPFCILIAKEVVIISILSLNYSNRAVTFIAEQSDNTLIKKVST